MVSAYSWYLVERENFENRPRPKFFSACARLPRWPWPALHDHERDEMVEPCPAPPMPRGALRRLDRLAYGRSPRPVDRGLSSDRAGRLRSIQTSKVSSKSIFLFCRKCAICDFPSETSATPLPPFRNALRLEKNCELMRCSLTENKTTPKIYKITVLFQVAILNVVSIHSSGLLLLPWPKNQLQARYSSWGRYTVRSRDVVRYRRPSATQACNAQLLRVTSMFSRSGYRTISHDRTVLILMNISPTVIFWPR